MDAAGVLTECPRYRGISHSFPANDNRAGALIEECAAEIARRNQTRIGPKFTSTPANTGRNIPTLRPIQSHGYGRKNSTGGYRTRTEDDKDSFKAYVTGNDGNTYYAPEMKTLNAAFLNEGFYLVIGQRIVKTQVVKFGQRRYLVHNTSYD